MFASYPDERPEVIALAEAALCTSQMLRYVKLNSHDSFIIGGIEAECDYCGQRDRVEGKPGY